ncbi:lipopolysaccharide heptosyltransferase II [bacterium]|nr:lipopolysaccharide heptosyltransferase II [candidate division CSSED10-310 bacterium]
MIPGNSTIVVGLPNWIGDAVMCTAALHSIRRSRPDLKIIAVSKPWVSELFRHCPSVDQNIVYHHRNGLMRALDTASLCRTLHSHHPAAAILFQTSFESALAVFLAGVPVRIGQPTDNRRLFLTHPIKLTEAETRSHQVVRYLTVARAAVGTIPADSCPSVNLSDRDRRDAAALLKPLARNGPLITLAPGAAFGPAKRWPPDRFAEFIRRAQVDWRADVVICGGPGDGSIADRIIRDTGSSVVDLTRKASILVQAAVIEQSDLCVSNDSGLMHLAAAMNTRVVAVFGPTVPGVTGPWGNGHIILHEAVPCAPCRYRECPVDHICMTRVTVDSMILAAGEILGEKTESS